MKAPSIEPTGTRLKLAVTRLSLDYHSTITRLSLCCHYLPPALPFTTPQAPESPPAMALHYNLVFAILVVELALFTIIVLPIPSKIRSPLLTSISLPLRSIQVQVAVKTILFFILVLFIDAFNRSRTIELSLASEMNPPHRADIQAKRFYAQRNVYLTGFTLFLTLIVNRTYLLTSQLLEIKKTTRSGALSSKDADEINSKHFEQLQAELKEKDEELRLLKLKAGQLTQEYSDLK